MVVIFKIKNHNNKIPFDWYIQSLIFGGRTLTTSSRPNLLHASWKGVPVTVSSSLLSSTAIN